MKGKAPLSSSRNARDQWLEKAEGCAAARVFTPHTIGDDGVRMSIWRSDEAMLNASYRQGQRKTQMDRNKAVPFFDRSSFTRFRILEAAGQWDGQDPLAPI